MRVNIVPHCSLGFLAAIVGASLQKKTPPKWPKWWTMNYYSPSGVKRKWVAKDFSAFITQYTEEVIRLVEDEEFSVWCDKNLLEDSLDEDDDDGDELQRGGGDVVDKISCTANSQLLIVLNKLSTIINGKSVHFPFRKVWVLKYFLAIVWSL